jgi:hypothetical protein
MVATKVPVLVISRAHSQTGEYRAAGRDDVRTIEGPRGVVCLAGRVRAPRRGIARADAAATGQCVAVAGGLGAWHVPCVVRGPSPI